jgi:hypothetical protein
LQQKAQIANFNPQIPVGMPPIHPGKDYQIAHPKSDIANCKSSISNPPPQLSFKKGHFTV